ncbi:MAG: SxtJ family membrane protein [Pseudomonadota bacterium]
MAVSARLTPAQGRKFAFTLGIALLVLGAFSLWRGHTIVPYVLLAPGAVLLLAGLVIPQHLGPIERAWMALGHKLSVVMTPIVMFVLFFGTITSFGLLMRAFGKRPLTENHQPRTAWVDRKKPRSDLKRQF